MNIFIGSSKESLHKAEEIAAHIDRNGHKSKICTDEEFIAGRYIFDSLIDITNKVDAAIFVFNEDDKQWYRETEVAAVRDNVLLEYGLFCGVLGKHNVAICINGKPKIASDLNGLIYIDINEWNDAKVKLRSWLENCQPKKTLIDMEESYKQTLLYHKENPKSDETLKKWERFLEEYPEHIPARIDKAWTYYEKGNYKKTAHLLEEEVYKFNSIRLHYLIGLAHRAARDYQSAIRHFNTCICIDRNLHDKMGWFAHLSHKYLSEIYTILNNNEEATKHKMFSEQYT